MDKASKTSKAKEELLNMRKQLDKSTIREFVEKFGYSKIRMLLEELDDTHEITYAESLICWVDILGFSAWVNNTRKEKGKDSREKVTILRNLFAGATKLMTPWKDKTYRMTEGMGLAGATKTNYRYTHFSDTIVISTSDKSADGAVWLCEKALELAVYLTQNKMPFRGAIVQGELYHSHSNVFGPAVIDAHYLETKCANYPRIVIEPGLATTFDKCGVSGKYLMQDSDLIYYLDYIGKVWGNDIDVSSTEECLKTLKCIYEMSVEGKKNADVSVAMKYNWLANKYDEHLRFLRAGALDYKYDDHRYKQINHLSPSMKRLLTDLCLIHPAGGEEPFHI